MELTVSNNPQTPIADELLSNLVKSLPDLHTSGVSDDASLKEMEARYSLRLKIVEQAFRSRELSLKEQAQTDDKEVRNRELSLKEQASTINKWANPLTVGVIVAALGLLGNFVNGLWSNLNQRAQLENQKVTERIKLENELLDSGVCFLPYVG